MNYEDDLVRFFKERATPLSSKPHEEHIRKFYREMKPFLSKGKYSETMSKNDRVKFIGEVFTLWIYAKRNKVENWEYEPKVGRKKPDFIINDGSIYVEIYNPQLNYQDELHDYDYYTKLYKKSVSREITTKSRKYKHVNLVILISIVVNEFIEDYIESLKRVQLSNQKHSIFLYHGDSQYII